MSKLYIANYVILLMNLILFISGSTDTWRIVSSPAGAGNGWEKMFMLCCHRVL